MNIVSFGGGTNSTAMIVGMWQRGIPIDLITFADTGGERPETYAYIRLFNGWLRSRGLPNIRRAWYRTEDGARLTLERECLKSHTLPSIAYGRKGCSLKHKLGTQAKFCNNYAPCRREWATGRKVHKYIGYDAGETRRVEHARESDAMDPKYEYHYPLVAWGWDRERCREEIRRAGLPLPGKSSCFFCPSAKKAEIRDLWEQHPDLFRRAIALEHTAADTLVTVKGLGRAWSWEDYHDAYVSGLPIHGYSRDQCALDGFDEPVGGCLCGAPCGCYDG